ncbi:MAG: hypothetical protein AAFW98_07520 [Pseudomonadota bacterium]
MKHLAVVLANATTLVEPEVIVFAGGALNQPRFELSALRALLDARRYPGTCETKLVVSAATDPNLRGAAMLLATDDHSSGRARSTG